ncbi:hypothetical protein GCM10023115_22410 [Pontixanthobacter gangjinensis]|uniref:Ribonuclease n=1 Tax=Pontixanthobacter gangjinensis TaxID=1028742 RepID=A0A6I4SP16_9SPHN|nr:ribonuclease E/G [Pontixanthobacter gangjinensis]MXO57484.1 ribonuclease [Pontixanthobacter gangjinensis]
MADWLVERGIGEDRAIAIENDRIIAARTQWDGELVAGQVIDAKLISRSSGSSRGKGELPSGSQILLDRLPKDAAEGALLRVEIKRSAIGERGRLKLAQARPSDRSPTTPDILMSLEQEGHCARIVHQFPESDWDELLSDALSGEIHFKGGSLLLAATPAMIIIDIDGTLPPCELALAASGPIADTLRRFDIGGMVGIDFPTLEQKSDRKAVDAALAEALGEWSHERTAMNGFGFVQIISRLQRPSLLHRATHARTAILARQLLRQAQMIAEPGALLLTIHPALQKKLKPEWLEELSRRTGREVRIELSAGLALGGSFAQAVPI